MSSRRLPTLVGLSDIAALFGVEKQTAYRWNIESGGRKRVLPEPDARMNDLSGEQATMIWTLDTILGWGEETGRAVVPDVVARIRAKR